MRVSSVLCRVQQVNRVSDLRAARARPEDGHCPLDCSRQRARGRARRDRLRQSPLSYLISSSLLPEKDIMLGKR